MTALAIAWHSVSGQQRAVYPVPESDLIVEPFAIPTDWPRVYALHVGSGSIAGIWGALDPVSRILYLYHEYFSRDFQPQVHAQAIWSRSPLATIGRPRIRGVMGFGNGRNLQDEYRLMEMYRDLGLDLEPADNLVESGIVEVLQRMSVGGLKVFSSLPNYWAEFRLYRRDERGPIAMESGNLQDATRCLVVSGVQRLSVKKVPVPKEWSITPRADGLAWMDR